MPERGLAQVERHCNCIGLYLVPIFQKDIHKAKNGMGKNACVLLSGRIP